MSPKSTIDTSGEFRLAANIIDGVYFSVGGDAGKTNGLAWSLLEDMGYYLQELIHDLAKYNLDSPGSPKLDQFEIELFDFRPGSAIPAFRLVPTQQLPMVEIINEKRTVASQFDALMASANTGDYEKYFERYLLPDVTYELAEDVHRFAISAGKSPITVVKPITKGNPKPIYEVRKFTKRQSDYLLRSKRPAHKDMIEPQEMFGLIRRTGSRRKIVDVYEGNDTVLSFAPPAIVTLDRVYDLHSPLLCTVKKEDEYFVIENDMLDLYASGKSINEAEFDFYNEFDSSYKWFQDKPNDQLSDRLLRAKQMMTSYIKSITNQ